MLHRIALRFAQDRKANVAVTFGIAIVPLMLAIGASVDYGRTLNATAAAQASLDGAVLAAAVDTSGDPVSTANRVLDATLVGQDFSVVSRTTVQNSDGSLTTSASISVPTTIMSVVVPSINMTLSATAATGTSPQPVKGLPTCILLLDPSMQHAFSSRSNSSLDASTCDVHVNSNGSGTRNMLDHWEDSDQASKAAIFVSDSNFKFGSFCAVGAVQGSVPGLGPSCSGATVDPFVGKLPSVSPGDCSPANTYSGTTIVGPTPNATYCGNVLFAGTIPSGIYYIRTATSASSSKLTITGNSRGNGVTFYFVDATATLDVTGAGTSLTAPTSGPYAGYLVFMPSNLAKTNVTITSLDKNYWSGVLYTPSWNIEIHSWSQDMLAALTWVANSMVWDSESQVKLTQGPIGILSYANGVTQLSTDAPPVSSGGSAVLVR